MKPKTLLLLIFCIILCAIMTTTAQEVTTFVLKTYFYSLAIGLLISANTLYNNTFK